jgi:hypothetical protein
VGHLIASYVEVDRQSLVPRCVTRADRCQEVVRPDHGRRVLRDVLVGGDLNPRELACCGQLVRCLRTNTKQAEPGRAGSGALPVNDDPEVVVAVEDAPVFVVEIIE